MSKWIREVCATTLVLSLAGTAVGQVTAGSSDSGSTTPPSTTTAPPASPGQARVAAKFSAPFATMAGSSENATALANALRTGTPATLTYTSTGADGKVTVTTMTITPPTKPMGWGNVSHSLALAQFALAQAGITSPTGAQLQAALTGGDVTTADGKTVTLAGVLQQRADGMGWGKIAQSYGTTMGAVNRGIKAPTVVATSPPTAPTAPPSSTLTTRGSPIPVATTQGMTTAGGTTTTTVQTAKGVTTAAGASSGVGHGAKGITTAGGSAVGPNPSAKGMTTASGGGAGGIVAADGSAHGNGNAYGRGVVTASGGAASVASAAGASAAGSSGVVTGNGAVASGVVTADPGNGAGSAKSHAKGKSGGG